MPRKRKTPIRMCLGCRQSKAKRELIRVVRTPQGEIELDFTGKKAGRGAYICPSADCLRKAIRGKGLSRSLESPIPEHIIATLKEQLENR
ncbi:MAG TPA: YlxR family protein [Firmicutes bacterium]|jgi:predicted RNA-binding protein YlxR (DUF448 family)|nr:YlxR family protein [Bacillota bacterium]